METFPFSLVLISIFTHAYWNYLIKRAKNKHIFTALSKLAEVLIFLFPAIYFFLVTNFQSEFLFLILIAGVITFLNYFFLSSAYKYGDLSLVYPIARSSIIFLPIIAFYFIGERIDTVGILAISLILLGTFVMHMESFDRPGIRTIFKNIGNKGSMYAVLAAFTVACYTIWDKISISRMQPFLYFYLYTFIVAILYNAIAFYKFEKDEIKTEWQLNRWRIIKVGFFNSFTYILVLIALTTSKASYVGGLRQLSIVIGAFFGFRFLKEKLGTPRLVGILISILGVCLIYFAK
ncbi:DMT family transporter [Flagellimonas meishanensis]|uniref:DMT family transporter n=1 Tax=Flagellimonas meishanensis TaxID=2873264 RepID=UPI00223AB05C|nr:DMT family transporter [[Muricauda] meishanensis]